MPTFVVEVVDDKLDEMDDDIAAALKSILADLPMVWNEMRQFHNL